MSSFRVSDKSDKFGDIDIFILDKITAKFPYFIVNNDIKSSIYITIDNYLDSFFVKNNKVIDIIEDKLIIAIPRINYSFETKESYIAGQHSSIGPIINSKYIFSNSNNRIFIDHKDSQAGNIKMLHNSLLDNDTIWCEVIIIVPNLTEEDVTIINRYKDSLLADNMITYIKENILKNYFLELKIGREYKNNRLISEYVINKPILNVVNESYIRSKYIDKIPKSFMYERENPL